MLAIMLELRAMGFAEDALKMLTDILQQIAKKNKINTQLAAAQFLFEIKHNYDKVLGFKAALNNITAQVTEESKKLIELQTNNAASNDAVLAPLIYRR